MDDPLNNIFNAKLSSGEFQKLSRFITEEYGIKLPPEKKIMLQSRLQKRLKVLQIDNYKQYIDFVFSDEGRKQELIHMIDVVTTNKTDFFRENRHFQILIDEILPTFQQQSTGYLNLKVWSAGCSSGEEPYTLAMVLNEYAQQHGNMDFQILGSDISYLSLRTALDAIYPEEKVAVVPMSLKKKYLLRSKDRNQKKVRVVQALRKKVKFKQHNLMDPHYDIHEHFDLVFCRNVLIYFHRESQEKIINKLASKLKPTGYFFLGHSESILNLDVPLKQYQSTVYTKKQ